MSTISNKIEKFRGEYNWLSNFYYSEFYFDNIKWYSVEQCYQAYKCLYKEDFLSFVNEKDPKKCKSLSKDVVHIKSFNKHKAELMYEIVFEKFNQNEHLKEKLINLPTNIVIEEGNDWGDTFWGICNGKGENHLGKIIMKIKKELTWLDF